MKNYFIMHGFLKKSLHSPSWNVPVAKISAALIGRYAEKTATPRCFAKTPAIPVMIKCLKRALDSLANGDSITGAKNSICHRVNFQDASTIEGGIGSWKKSKSYNTDAGK